MVADDATIKGMTSRPRKPAGAPRTISDAVRQAVVADARRTVGTADGSVRQVAARHGISEASVRRIVAAAEDAPQFGAPETRAKMQNAIEATRLSLAERRQRLAERFVHAAEKALADMESQTWKVFNFGGKDNTFEMRVIDCVPTQDQRNLMIIAGTAIDKHKMLDQYDSDQREADAVTAWIRNMTGRGDVSDGE
jgi:transposase-like protein